MARPVITIVNPPAIEDRHGVVKGRMYTPIAQGPHTRGRRSSLWIRSDVAGEVVLVLRHEYEGMCPDLPIATYDETLRMLGHDK